MGSYSGRMSGSSPTVFRSGQHKRKLPYCIRRTNQKIAVFIAKIVFKKHFKRSRVQSHIAGLVIVLADLPDGRLLSRGGSKTKKKDREDKRNRRKVLNSGHINEYLFYSKRLQFLPTISLSFPAIA